MLSLRECCCANVSCQRHQGSAFHLPDAVLQLLSGNVGCLLTDWTWTLIAVPGVVQVGDAGVHGVGFWRVHRLPGRGAGRLHRGRPPARPHRQSSGRRRNQQVPACPAILVSASCISKHPTQWQHSGVRYMDCHTSSTCSLSMKDGRHVMAKRSDTERWNGADSCVDH